MRTVSVPALVWMFFVLGGVRAAANHSDTKSAEVETVETVKKDLEVKINVLQLKNEQLEKQLEKTVADMKKMQSSESIESLIIKELEKSSAKEALEEGKLKLIQRENRKLKSMISNSREIRQNDNPKNRSAIDLAHCLNSGFFPYFPFSVNVRGANAVFETNFNNLGAYKRGFQGGQSAWLGLDRLHELTSTGNWDLLVSFKWGEDGGDNQDKGGNCLAIGTGVDSKSGTWGWGRWPNFKVDDASNGYAWHYGPLAKSNNFRDCDVLDVTSGNGNHDGQEFSFKACDGGFWYASQYNFAPTSSVPTFIDVCHGDKDQYYTGTQAIMAIISSGL